MSAAQNATSSMTSPKKATNPEETHELEKTKYLRAESLLDTLVGP
jgi:hypothetical protein